jgi:phosphoglycolate phosphatase
MKAKGIVFDFDGPIFDGRLASSAALERTKQKFGPPSVDLHVLPLLRPSQLIALVYAESGLSAETLKEACTFYRQCLTEEEARIDAPDDVRVTIEQLAADGFKLAILTSRPEAEVRALLSHLQLERHFGAVVGCDTAAVRKPSPDAVKDVAGRLGLEVDQVVVVGDSDTDFDAAKHAAGYYHAAWPGEPCGRAATDENAVVLRNPRDLRIVLGGRDRTPQTAVNALPANLREAIDAGAFCFYAGAGVSVPSGIGGWDDHYLPILTELDARPLTATHSLPEILQFLASDTQRARDVFDRFRDSFDKPQIQPNAYHFAMQRSGAPRIWTSNYDELFEKADVIAGFGRKVAVDDRSLLRYFRDSRLLIKMNGDFRGAGYSAVDLRWNLVLTQEQFDVADNDRREIWRLFEDDYRNTCLVFVGVSFTDPVLRRIVTTVRQRIPSTRYTHLLLVREAKGPAEALEFGLQAQSLRRDHIETLFFRDFKEITRFVARIAARASRPIVGFSGDARLPPGAAAADTLPNATLSTSEIERICAALAAKLARRGLRVTSGHGPGVGIPAVAAAFDVNPSLSRFYLRKSGTSSYERTAPAIIVPGETYGPMRERFIGELSLLVALGGVGRANETQPGTIAEIELALSRRVPVILIPQAGGHVFDYRPGFLERLGAAYRDASLAASVRAANEKIWSLGAAELVAFAQGDMVTLLEDVIADAAGAAVDFKTVSTSW